MRIYFASRDFQSSQQVIFKIYNSDGNIIYTNYGQELGDSGVYFISVNLDFGMLFWKKEYIVIAEEINGDWKATKHLTKEEK